MKLQLRKHEKVRYQFSFHPHQDQFLPVLSVRQRYSFGRGVLDSLLRQRNFARQGERVGTELAHIKRGKHAICKRRGKTQEAKSLLLPNWLIKQLVCSDWLST